MSDRLPGDGLTAVGLFSRVGGTSLGWPGARTGAAAVTAQDAIAEIPQWMSHPRNYEWLVDADIEACFDASTRRV